MSDPAIKAILSQIQSVSGKLQSSSRLETEGLKSASFSDVFKQSIEQVNTLQKNASALAESFERGDANVELSSVMIEMQKARLSFEALSQVRTRLVSAYQEIMNMQV